MVYRDILQLHAVTSKNFIEKRRNIRVTLCEFFSHFILFLVLLMGFGLSKVLFIPARQYSTRNIDIPPKGLTSLLRSLLKGPIVAPSFSQYMELGDQLRSQIASQGITIDLLLRTPFGDQFANLLLGGTLHLSPQGVLTDSFIAFLNETSANFENMKILTHENENAAVKYILSNLDERTLALVVLDEVRPEVVKYSLRFNYTTIPNTNVVFNPLNIGLGKNYQLYFSSGFMSLQRTVNEWVYNYNGASVAGSSAFSDCHLPLPTYTPYPTAAYNANPFFERVGFLLGLALVMSTLYPLSRLTKCIVEEKEIKMRELMKISGLKDWIHQLSWFINGFILFLWIAISSTYISTNSFMPLSNKVLIFSFFFLFAMSEITLSFLISVFFSNSKFAAIAAPVVLFCCVLPRYVFVGTTYFEADSAKMIASLLSPTAFSLGASIISQFEASNQGVQFSNINYGGYTFANVLQMLFVDTVLYGILAWYFDLVLVHDYGTTRHPLFFLFPNYWISFFSCCCVSCCEETEYTKSMDVLLSKNDILPSELSDRDDNCNIEKVATSDRGKVRVVIKNAQKTYSNGKVAVKNVDLAMLEGHVTCLLGHNGAGKSTTMSLLTGMTTLTGGFCSVYGNDLNSDLRNIRSITGVCMQDDVLYPSLTVREHLNLFGAIKGLSWCEINAAVEEIAGKVCLTEKLNVISSSLSGGMKRKLCLAIALIGNPKFLILDEPTSGMDPFSRRAIWELIQKVKHNKVVLLTTHFMDEADILGDRIAILSEGEMRCSGTSLFLKTRFGAGYVLTISLLQNVSEKALNSRQIEAITSVIKENVPMAILKSAVAGETVYVLPLDATTEFANLFNALKSQSGTLGIGYFGVTITSLEQVFVSLANERNALIASGDITNDSSSSVYNMAKNVTNYFIKGIFKQPVKNIEYLPSEDIEIPEISIDIENNETEEKDDDASEPPLHLSSIEKVEIQLIELLRKRFIIATRDLKGFFFQVLFPVLQVVLILAVLTVQFNPAGQKLALTVLKNLGSTGIANANNTVPWLSPEFLPMSRNHYTMAANTSKDLSDVYFAIVAPELPHSISNRSAEDVEKLSNIPSRYGSYVYNDSIYTNVRLDISSALQLNTSQLNVSQLNVSQILDLVNSTILDNIDISILETFLATNITSLNLSSAQNFTVTTPSEVTIMHNSSGDHAVAFYNGDLVSSAYKQCLPTGSEFTVYNHPLPVTELFSVIVKVILSIIAGLFILVPLCYLPASFVTFLVKERTSKSKHLQLVSSVSPKLYWIATYIWDYFLYSILMMSIIATLFGYSNTISNTFVSNASATTAVFLLLASYGLAVLPLSYLYSMLFDNHSTAQISITVVHFISGFIFVIAYYITISIPEVAYIGRGLIYFFWFFPTYNIGAGLLNVSTTYYVVFLTGIEQSYLHWNITGRNIVFMILQAVAYFSIVLLTENADAMSYFSVCKAKFGRIIGSILAFCMKNSSFDENENFVEYFDEDVEQEKAIMRDCILNNKTSEYDLVLDDITKIYDSSFLFGNPKRAVRGISFGLTSGERFGLLGVNGAGKSTTLNILTGDISPSSGQAFIAGFLLSDESTKQYIGYCPQTDPLLDLLNAYETLWFYGRIRCSLLPGVLTKRIQTLINEVGLTLYADRPCGTYSGGNKRKLSLALALIGDPKVLFLDEPSTGMDPEARRAMWDVIAKISTSRSVVLTTHSMEECEALCTRIGIMTSGRFRCIGSSQHIKSKFGAEYQIEIRSISAELLDICVAEMKSQDVLPADTLEDEKHEGFVRLRTFSKSQRKHGDQGIAMNECIHSKGHQTSDAAALDLAKVFSFIEVNKGRFGIVSYSISQATLEQIFIQIAKEDQPNDIIQTFTT